MRFALGLVLIFGLTALLRSSTRCVPPGDRRELNKDPANG